MITPTPSTNTPQIELAPELPVSLMRTEIEAAIRSHQVVIVAGETGSGKTTQLPKIALGLGRERIAHTQPRRIAARTIAERIAEELGVELGGLVGYQVRFTDRASKDTKIRLMTDGILLNAVHRDRELRDYDTIIIDEAHERSLNIDFLLGYLKRLLPKRPDLKVIITSATIDPVSFAKHFADVHTGEPAPIIEVSGRTFPVEIRYRPLVEHVERVHPKTGEIQVRKVERDMFDAIGDAVDELSDEPPGDILVFLSGEAEIRDAADTLTGRYRGRLKGKQTEVLPLYGRLTAAEQHRVFEPGTTGARRIVLATNVAETSLTVPGIKYVIDAGTARISRYSAKSKVQRLPIEAVSQASANQRSGRSGRTSNGIAIRLYSEEDFNTRPVFTEPEIQRTGLASVILQMLALGLGDISKYPFLTPPNRRDVSDGLGLLTELGAVRDAAKGGRITQVGRQLSRLPIEPRFARMVLEADRKGVLDQVIAIVAGLTIQDVRERPTAERGKADEAHARFADPLGDIITLLNLWNYLQEQQQQLSSSAFRRLCKAEYLNYLRVREWMDLVRQITGAARSIRQSEQPETSAAAPGALSDLIHQSVLAGLLSRLGVRDDAQNRTLPATKTATVATPQHRRKAAQEYVGSRGTRFALHPSSVLAKQPPEVLMSVELVETSRLFARGNAVVKPEWAEALAGSLVKTHRSEPHWEKKLGSAVVFERVTLYGVPIVERRKVQLARFDAPLARELFIRHALVEGEWESPQAFDRANRQLRRELGQLEERARRRDLVGDDEAVFEFYDARIPESITSVRDFEGWWKTAMRSTPKLLNMKREDLLEDDTDLEIDESEFPRQWHHGDQQLRLQYRFDPTAEDDGVTVAVPLPLLPRVDGSVFEKLVPGLREELVTALIKTLPKAIRKHVVPAADWARTLLSAVSPVLDSPTNTESLRTLLAAEIQRRTSVRVSASDFEVDRLPAHLTPTFRVVDARGKTIGLGKDLASLQHTHKAQAAAGVAKIAAASLMRNDLERTGLTTWNFGDIPKHVDTAYAGAGRGVGTVRAYPALVDRKHSVDLILVADPAEQARLSASGIRRLLTLSSPSPSSYIRSHLTNDEKLLLGAGPYRTLDDAIADVSLAVADRAIQRHASNGLVWQESVFEQIANEYARALIDEIYGGIALTAKVLAEARKARKAIDQAKSLHILSQVADAKSQLDALIWASSHAGVGGFVSRAGLQRLERIPVYLQAISHRMRVIQDQPGRDRAWQNDVDRATEAYRGAGGTLPLRPDSPTWLEQTRWLIEELRISLFAQQLKTPEPVSLARILKLITAGQSN